MARTGRAPLLGALARAACLAAALALLVLPPAGCSEEKSGGERQPPKVRLAEVVSLDFAETVKGIGTLEARQEVRIRPEVAGVVEEVRFREGQQVKSGDVLFVLDDGKIKSTLAAERAALAKARVELADAERILDRFKALYDARTISKEELDQRMSNKEGARAEVERLEAGVALYLERLDDTTIRALASGRVSERLVDPGDYVEEGERMATLYTQGAIEISFTVPERVMGRVRVGQQAEVMVTAFPDRDFPAEVIYVAPSIDPSSRKLTAKALACNDEGLLIPGAFAEVTVVLGVRRDRPAVPEEALVATREGYRLFVVEEGVARLSPVEVGLRTPGVAEVRQGIEAGQLVVSQGQMRLSDGQRVEPIPGEDPAAWAPEEKPGLDGEAKPLSCGVGK